MKKPRQQLVYRGAEPRARAQTHDATQHDVPAPFLPITERNQSDDKPNDPHLSVIQGLQLVLGAAAQIAQLS